MRCYNGICRDTRVIVTRIHAVMAESADAQDSGSCGGNPVEVQVLLTAPLKTIWLKSTSTSPKRLAYEDTFAEVLVVHV